jgi:hypothetical protein
MMRPPLGVACAARRRVSSGRSRKSSYRRLTAPARSSSLPLRPGRHRSRRCSRAGRCGRPTASLPRRRPRRIHPGSHRGSTSRTIACLGSPSASAIDLVPCPREPLRCRFADTRGCARNECCLALHDPLPSQTGRSTLRARCAHSALPLPTSRATWFSSRVSMAASELPRAPRIPRLVGLIPDVTFMSSALPRRAALPGVSTGTESTKRHHGSAKGRTSTLNDHADRS